MQRVTTRRALREARAKLQGRVGFVPTMGALHDGHMTLVRNAADACDHTIVSVFVNPTQFGNPEDLEKYPNTIEQDLKLLEGAGVTLVFTPSREEMYGDAGDTFVETPHLATTLMGALRPGHFRGVATVVTKLFNLVQPHMAWFGAKDYQQVLVIKQIVRDLDMPVEIIASPTVRENDGLAMSSRNLRLTPENRQASVVIYQALQAAQKAASDGLAPKEIVNTALTVINKEQRGVLQSLDLLCSQTLTDLEDAPLEKPAVMLIAVDFGGILLIDNQVLTPPSL